MARIAVIGAKGTIGSRIVDEALARGHQVTAVVREPAGYQAPEGVAVAAGDVLDPAAVDASGESRISAEDYAVAIVDEIERPQFVGVRFTVGY